MAPYTWRQPHYPSDESDLSWIEPTALIICQYCDLDTALQPLLRTLQEPIGKNLVGSVFVQEAIREQFVERVRQGMTLVHRLVRKHNYFRRAMQHVACLHCETVTMMQTDEVGLVCKPVEGSPVLVCDFNQTFFNSRRPSTIVTMHTFRTTRELSKLFRLEPLLFASAAVWCSKMAAAYEVALQLTVPTVYINCAAVSLRPVQNVQTARVVLANDHHYEVVQKQHQHGDQRLVIVFPAPLWRPPPPPLTAEELKALEPKGTTLHLRGKRK